MNNVAEYTRCSHCGACWNSCPVDAISVNEEGLFYEICVDENTCIHCGLCQRVCPVNAPESRQQVQAAYGLVHNDANIVKMSSSGGAFSAIAEYVMERGGVVFGAAYSDDCRSVEICSTMTKTLDDLRRSKYVESKVGDSFRQVKDILSSTDQLVLYCGAPCQIAGLKRYLGREYDNLITCDFTCNGMPSHGIYDQYLSMIEKKINSCIREVNFRSKKYGWKYLSIRIKGQNRRVYQRLINADVYFSCFVGAQHHASVREYCLNCDFANNHYADIILADFWNYKTVSDMHGDNTGISLLITNSPKGERVVSEISDKVELTVLDTESACYNLKPKSFSDEVVKRRAAFIESVQKDGFAAVAKTIKLRSTIKLKVRYLLEKILGR